MNTIRFVVCSCFLMLLSAPSLAASGTFEIGGGVTNYEPVGNGIWYQKGFPYRLKLRSAAWMLGWQQPITERLVLHVDWVSLGAATSNSWDTPVDANYNSKEERCYGECVSMANFVGRGSASGLAVSLSQHFGRGGWFFVNAGLYLNRVKWEERVYNWQPSPPTPARDLDVVHRARWEVALVTGVGVRFGRFTLMEQYYPVSAKGDGVPAIFHGANVLMMTVRY